MAFEDIRSIDQRATESGRQPEDPEILAELTRDLIAARQRLTEATGAPLIGLHTAVSEALRIRRATEEL